MKLMSGTAQYIKKEANKNNNPIYQLPADIQPVPT
jgi:hypothetical protein